MNKMRIIINGHMKFSGKTWVWAYLYLLVTVNLCINGINENTIKCQRNLEISLLREENQFLSSDADCVAEEAAVCRWYWRWWHQVRMETIPPSLTIPPPPPPPSPQLQQQSLIRRRRRRRRAGCFGRRKRQWRSLKRSTKPLKMYVKIL